MWDRRGAEKVFFGITQIKVSQMEDLVIDE
jgi:hypothetical protein